eukprot:SAG31_NODE_16931_length_690_cov_0.768190_1_plen_22_part_01
MLKLTAREDDSLAASTALAWWY